MANLQPLLRFPAFKEEWVKCNVLDIAPLQRGFDLPVIEIIHGVYPVVFSNGISKYHNQFKSKGPGVVTGRSGTIGKITYVEENYWPHNTSLWVTDFKENNPKYIYYFYLQFDLSRFSSGSGVPTLNRNDIHNQIVNIPSVEEQTKIATFLSSVDEKLNLLKEKKALLEEYKKGMMQQFFSQQLRFKDEDGQDFKDWEEKSLAEICDVNKGNQLNKDSLNKNDLYPCISGGIEPSGFTHEYNRNENTIIISEGGNSCGFVNFITTKFWCGGHCYSIDLKNDSISNLFLFQLLKFNQEEIMKLRVGSGLPNIQKKDLLKFEIKISKNLKEQSKIANFLSAIDEKIELVSQQIEDSQEYKRGLLQGMFC